MHLSHLRYLAATAALPVARAASAVFPRTLNQQVPIHADDHDWFECPDAYKVPGNSPACFSSLPDRHILDVSNLFVSEYMPEELTHPIDIILWGAINGDIGENPRCNITVIGARTAEHDEPTWLVDYEFGLNEPAYGVEISQPFGKWGSSSLLTHGPVQIRTALPPLKAWLDRYRLYVVDVAMTATDGRRITGMKMLLWWDD